jgi:hypothetical protein
MGLLVSSTLRLVYNIEAPRVCSACGSTKTNNRWYRDGNSGYHCNRCQMKLVYNPRWHPLTNPRRIVFKGKQIYLTEIKESLRKGICSLCGVRVGQFHPVTGHYCKQTHMHHLQYDPSNPLAHTIEVCIPCHKQEHRRLLKKI